MKLLRLLSDLIIKKKNLKRIKKFYEIYCNTIVDSFCVECSNYKTIKPYALTKYN
jgi:hypothetical protein